MASEWRRPRTIKLFSGDDPRIPKGDGPEPVTAFIDAAPGWKGEVGRWLDDLIVEVVPDAQKAVRWNSPFHGIEGRGWFLSTHCFAKYEKVTFLRGVDLDPQPPIDSKHEFVRYARIDQAAKLPGDELF